MFLHVLSVLFSFFCHWFFCTGGMCCIPTRQLGIETHEDVAERRAEEAATEAERQAELSKAPGRAARGSSSFRHQDMGRCFPSSFGVVCAMNSEDAHEQRRGIRRTGRRTLTEIHRILDSDRTLHEMVRTAKQLRHGHGARMSQMVRIRRVGGQEKDSPRDGFTVLRVIGRSKCQIGAGSDR